MAKKNLDKVFSDALRQHQTPTPKGAWERIERGLDGKSTRRKRRKVWFWLLFLTAGMSGVSYGAWQYRQAPKNMDKVAISKISLTEDELRVKEEDIQQQASSVPTNKITIDRKTKTEISNNRTKQEQKRQVQIPRRPVNTTPQKILHKQIMPTIEAPTRIAIPAMAMEVDRISIPSMAVKTPKKKYHIRIEITIPYRGKESKATSEPQKRKVNWRKVVKHILDD